jgi:hypothetical protein
MMAEHEAVERMDGDPHGDQVSSGGLAALSSRQLGTRKRSKNENVSPWRSLLRLGVTGTVLAVAAIASLSGSALAATTPATMSIVKASGG